MAYEKPAIVDYGSIGGHTFAAGSTPAKDTQLCTPDKFNEQSCPDVGSP